MCKWGDTVDLELPCGGSLVMKRIAIDRCISSIVCALNDAGMRTVSSCCGHGRIPASIILEDDSWIVVMDRKTASAFFEEYKTTIHGEKINPPEEP